MATNLSEIKLTEEQKRRIAAIADQSGRPWRDVLEEQLARLSTTDECVDSHSLKDPYIQDSQRRIAYFREWVSQQTSHNRNFDDSRESIYFDHG